MAHTPSSGWIAEQAQRTLQRLRPPLQARLAALNPEDAGTFARAI